MINPLIVVERSVGARQKGLERRLWRRRVARRIDTDKTVLETKAALMMAASQLPNVAASQEKKQNNNCSAYYASSRPA